MGLGTGGQNQSPWPCVSTTWATVHQPQQHLIERGLQLFLSVDQCRLLDLDLLLPVLLKNYGPKAAFGMPAAMMGDRDPGVLSWGAGASPWCRPPAGSGSRICLARRAEIGPGTF